MLDLHVLPALGNRKTRDIARADVERMHRTIRDAEPAKGQTRKGGPGVANRALALVSAIMAAAEISGERPANSNPARGVKRYRERDPHEAPRFLDAAERARLTAALDESEKAGKGHPAYVARGAVDAIRLLSWTGCRLGEIARLRWSMVDLDAEALRLPDSKTGEKTVEIPPQAVALLQRLDAARTGRRNPEDLVCLGEAGGPVANLQRAWRSIRKRAGLGTTRIHDLRHSFASDALNAGVPLAIVGAMLGHRNVQTTARYAHVADNVKREALRRTGDAIAAATAAGAEVITLPTATRTEPAPKAKPRGRRAKERR